MNRRLQSLGLLVLLAGCAQLGNAPTDAPASIAPTNSPAIATSAASPSAPATPGRTATPAPETDEPEDPVPPDAILTLPDGAQHVAALGSYFFGGAAADGPWLPATVLPPLEVPAESSFSVSVPPLDLVSWNARYADAQDEQAEVISPLASGGDGATALASATLPALPSGAWVLAVQVFFADEAGDAIYFWHVIVP